jgi:FAD/FMN-containing dehydrogenase
VRRLQPDHVGRAGAAGRNDPSPLSVGAAAATLVDARIRAIDAGAFAIVFGHAGDGNVHIGLHHKDTPEKHDEFEKLVYGITGEFGGSISAEHGIGILKRPNLRMSRTEEEIETMRTLKRALDPKNILNPGRVFTL